MQNAQTSIIETPGVCGGDRHIRGTRIPVWALEAARREGIDDAVILEMYPTITPEQLAEAMAYADEHADEMDRLIAENRDA